MRKISDCRSFSRGGEWYPENRGCRKFLIPSRNLGSFSDESRSLVFHVFLSISESAFLEEVLREGIAFSEQSQCC